MIKIYLRFLLLIDHPYNVSLIWFIVGSFLNQQEKFYNESFNEFSSEDVTIGFVYMCQFHWFV